MKTQDFTAAQRAAVDSEHPQILCVAGPGAGKSTTLAARVDKLIERGSNPLKIAVITYTNKAAQSILEKIGRPIGFAGTEHGLGLRMLRKHGASLGYGERTGVIDDDAAADLLASKAQSMGCKTPLKKLVEMKKAGPSPWGRALHDATKGQTLAVKLYRMTPDELAIAAYYQDLRESGLVDFDLILVEFLRLILADDGAIEAEFTDLLVDEVQDCNATDWAIFRAFPAARKFFVGDPRQAIFGFRGGDVREMERFACEPETEVLHLTDNFRCGSNICAAANNLMEHHSGRYKYAPTVSATGQTGDVDAMATAENEGEEIAKVVRDICNTDAPPEAIAVLARTNAIANGFREGLKAAGIPVVEPPRSELPRDWGFARSIVELAVQPRNDTLAYFFLLARSKNASVLGDAVARDVIHKLKVLATAAGKPLAPPELFAAGGPSIEKIAAFMDAQGISRETRALVAKLARELPPGADLSDLALAMARGEPEQSAEGVGVTCTTLHDAKGREWDVVFLVGFEDEVIPGNRKSDGPEEIEEERRLAFVGITRARHRVVFTSSKTRRATWGRQELQPHTPSRFIGEALP